MLKRLSLLVLLAAFAHAEHRTAFTGVWKLNVAKSKFHPGPPFQSFTLTFTPDGVRHLDLKPASGAPVRIDLPWSGGHPVTPIGMDDARTVSRIQGRDFRDTWRRDGKIIERVSGRVSADGKTLRIRVSGPDGKGGSFRNRLTFERQP